ncbi:carbohydrate ABC transporter permease [Clostridium grantii]|uniref:Putative aldouronate transport system permease protein n=1 Tax=Clostridium grantii DSM 8605 TaxID=1121316 RepID=A0A1M5WM97_9CLOT|nr:carbohydrate ABC transporter permease [Clostridium grantii]SHH88588.1 putative aldouronate transport system permease protein [Clostridium grantii DSM 8605]
MKSSKGERIFNTINILVLSLISLIALYPFVYVLSASLSQGNAVSAGQVVLFPKGIHFNSFKKVLTFPNLWIAYANTIYYTVVGTATCMFFSITGAYALSKKRLVGRKFFTILVTLTMWFKAGTIPEFLNFRSLGLYNTRAVPIIGFAIVAFNVILLKTYFESIPDSLEESAQIDGGSDFRILWSIYLPLAKPGIATVSLFYAVSKWNGYFWSMILLKDENKIPLQVLLRKMIVEMNAVEEFNNAVEMTSQGYSVETVVYATIIVSIIPIILVYPSIQKYFAKGAMIGAVKG